MSVIQDMYLNDTHKGRDAFSEVHIQKSAYTYRWVSRVEGFRPLGVKYMITRCLGAAQVYDSRDNLRC